MSGPRWRAQPIVQGRAISGRTEVQGDGRTDVEGVSVRVSVQLFGGARQRAGRARIELDLPESARVSDLRAALAAQEPALAPLLASVRIAVDSEYAEEDRVIPEGAELAVIPPVSGGVDGR